MAAIDADPGQLHLAAHTLTVAADEIDHLSTSTSRAGSDTTSSAHWSGGAADAFTSHVTGSARELARCVGPLRSIAAALNTFADAVTQARSDQATANEQNTASAHLPPEDRVAAHDAAQQAFDAAGARATAAAATAAAAVRSATSQLPARPTPLTAQETAAEKSGNGKALLRLAVGIETYQGVADKKAEDGGEAPETEFGGPPRTANDYVVSLATLLTTPAALASGARWLNVERQVAETPDLVRQLWGSFELAKEINNLSPSEAATADLIRSGMISTLYARDATRSAAASADFLAGGLPDTAALRAGGRALGGLGLVADGATLLDPHASGFDKAMSGANALGTTAYLATPLLVAQGLDVVPGVGEVVMVGTGAILAGEFVYKHRQAIEHFFTNTVPDVASHVVSDVGHVASDVGHDLGHAASSVGHDLNPTNWF